MKMPRFRLHILKYFPLVKICLHFPRAVKEYCQSRVSSNTNVGVCFILPSMSDWSLGVTLGILGSVAINTGNNLQSLGLKSLQQEEELTSRKSPADKPTRRIPWRSPTPVKIEPLQHNQNDSSEFEFVKAGKSPINSITWVVGTIIFISGSFLNFASYAFAAQV